jgi:O-antigen/teichoic acid export membrane protein
MTRPQLRGLPDDPLLRSAYSLMANTVVTAVLGFGFWIVAARLYPARVVGRDGALIAGLIELSAICQLNLANAIARFLPRLRGRAARALQVSYLASAAGAIVIGTAFVVIAPLISSDLAVVMRPASIAAVYVVSLVVWGVFTIEDAALTALRRAYWVPIENGVYGLLKLLALPILLVAGANHGVFLAWVIPVAILVVPVNLLLFARLLPSHARRDAPADSAVVAHGRRRLLNFVAQDYGGTVLARASTTILPLLVVATLGARENAYFYVAFTIAVAFDMLFYGVGTSLTVEGANAEHRLRPLARMVVRRFTVVLVPGALLLALAAPLILLPFGPDYVREGTAVLRILAIASLFRGAITFYEAVARVRGHGRSILVCELAQMAMLLGGAAVLAQPLGLEGVALAWLGSSVIVAGAVAPSLWRLLRPRAVPAPAPPPVLASGAPR